MALHRDIFWVGRQWAVTGHGMQLIDQKLKGYFDIDIARLWDDGLVAELRAKTWLNTSDFNRGLEVARARYPAPSRESEPPEPEQPTPDIPPVAPTADRQRLLSLLESVLRETPNAEPQTFARSKSEPSGPAGTDPIVQSGAELPTFNAKSAETPEPSAASPSAKPAARDFSMRVPRWPAKFVTVWRIRVR